jgi:hypothetical protein
MMELIAEDPYGLTAKMYFSILVKSSKPADRSFGNSAYKTPDKYVTAGYLYYFTIPTTAFYDETGGSALVPYI